MSNGGVRPNSPRHMRMVRTCRRCLIQHVRNHAQNVRKSAVHDLVFEVADDDGAEVAHDSDCLSPIRRNRAG